MVSYQHCTLKSASFLGASSCHLHIHLRRNLLQHSPSTACCSQLSSTATSPPRIQPSPPLHAISASHFLIWNTLCVTWGDGKQANEQGHFMSYNQIHLIWAVSYFPPTRLKWVCLWNGTTHSYTLFFNPWPALQGAREAKRDSNTLFFTFSCFPVRTIWNQCTSLVKGKFCSAGAKFWAAEPSRNAKRWSEIMLVNEAEPASASCSSFELRVIPWSAHWAPTVGPGMPRTRSKRCHVINVMF